MDEALDLARAGPRERAVVAGSCRRANATWQRGGSEEAVVGRGQGEILAGDARGGEAVFSFSAVGALAKWEPAGLI